MAELLNILLITTDTQRCDTLACMGYPEAVSPNLDRLARQGVLFEQGHTSSPVCSPARCSLMTGLHAIVHGCIENGVSRLNDLTMLPDHLARAGYTNIMVGKTHFWDMPSSFHVQHLLHGEKNSDADDFYARHIRRLGFGRNSKHPNDIPEEQFMDSFLATTCIQEMDRAAKQHKPFFAFCSMPSPHSPIDPPGRWASLFDDRPVPPIDYPEARLDGLSRHELRLLGLDGNDPPHRYTPDEVIARRKLYYGLSAYCDAQVGRLIEFLDQSGLRENTLVIFSSDHGETWYEGGVVDKHNYHDTTWRVPLILSMPGTLPSGQHRDFAIWNDLTATILAAAGLNDPCVQGFDLFSALRDGLPSPRKCAVASLYRSFAVTGKRWKLEYYPDEQRGRLFDRRNDPGERHDLYAAEEFRSIRDQLQSALLDWRSQLTHVERLHKQSHRGGPVAARAMKWTHQTTGPDAERQLNDRIEQIEAM